MQPDTDGDGLNDGQDPDPNVPEMPDVTVQYHWRAGVAWKQTGATDVSRVGLNSAGGNSGIILRSFANFDPATQAVGAMSELPAVLNQLPWLNQAQAEDLKVHVHACVAPANHSVHGTVVPSGAGSADCQELEVRIVPVRKVTFPVTVKFLQVQRSRSPGGNWTLEALPAGMASEVIRTAPQMTRAQQQNQNVNPLPSPAWLQALPSWTNIGLPNPNNQNLLERREILLLRVQLYNERRHQDITGALPAPAVPPANQPQINPGAFIREGEMAAIAAHQPGPDLNPNAADASDAPEMPRLVARIAGDLPGTTLTARWRLRVNYIRGNGARPAQPPPATDTVHIPALNQGTPQWSAPIAFNSEWRIFQDPDWINEIAQNGFFGGSAELFVWVTGQAQPAATQPPFLRFTIGGANPDDWRCRRYIDQQAPIAATNRVNTTNQGLGANPIAVGTGLWFAYAIAKSETQGYNDRGLIQNTRYNAFWEKARHQGRPRTIGHPIWNNDGVGLPGGYGLFQVTGTIADPLAIIPRRDIWNWQDNVRSGLVIVAYKKYGPDETSNAVLWMRRQRNANNANGTALPNYTVQGVTFSEGSAVATMEDAVTMKAYNGASGRTPNFDVNRGTVPGFRLDTSASGHHCYWRNASSEWALSRFNSPADPTIQPFNYVDRVCLEVGNP